MNSFVHNFSLDTCNSYSSALYLLMTLGVSLTIIQNNSCYQFIRIVKKTTRNTGGFYDTI